MSSFEDAFNRKRQALEAHEKEQEAKRAATLAEVEERLKSVLRVAPFVASGLVQQQVDFDVELTKRVEVSHTRRRLFGRSYTEAGRSEIHPTDYAGWHLFTRTHRSTGYKDTSVHTYRSTVLLPDGQIIGYSSTGEGGRTLAGTAPPKVLTPQYAQECRADDSVIDKSPFGNLYAVVNKLANLAVRHDLELPLDPPSAEQ